MSPLLLLAFVAPFEPSPHVYKPVVGETAQYSVRTEFQNESVTAGVTETMTTEILAIEPDGTARVKMAFFDHKGIGESQKVTFTPSEETARIDPYGRFREPEALGREAKVLGVGFALPPVQLTEKTWTVFPDPLADRMAEMEIEGTIASRTEDRIVFVARTKKAVDGQSFTRETVFNPVTGRLISVHLRGEVEGGPTIRLDLKRVETK